MLHWINSTDSYLWSTGSAEVHLDVERETGRLPVAVWCSFGSHSKARELAMIDTGAHWTLIGSELSEILGDELGTELESISMSTRLGKFHGTLHRLSIQLIADTGKDYTVDGTCLALPDWYGPSILGFNGFLERIRFAFEPATNTSPKARLHFGGV